MCLPAKDLCCTHVRPQNLIKIDTRHPEDLDDWFWSTSSCVFTEAILVGSVCHLAMQPD